MRVRMCVYLIAIHTVCTLYTIVRTLRFESKIITKSNAIDFSLLALYKVIREREYNVYFVVVVLLCGALGLAEPSVCLVINSWMGT